MQCYTRVDDYFGEIERFVRLQTKAGNINYDNARQGRAQTTSIKGHDEDDDQFWTSDYGFARTAGAALRMLMLTATNIGADKWSLVSMTSPGKDRNRRLINATDDERKVPTPAYNRAEAEKINAYYSGQFEHRKITERMKCMQFGIADTRYFAETMVVVKPGDNDIKFWFIMTTMRVYKLPAEQQPGFVYHAVPIVAVIYLVGNQSARAAYRQTDARPEILLLNRLMEELNIVGDLRHAIKENMAPLLDAKQDDSEEADPNTSLPYQASI